jgi:hypothetical protein
MLYVFGGEYKNTCPADVCKQQTRPGFHFGLVQPSAPSQTPYVYEGEEAARVAWRLAQHHSHLYSVSDDLTTVTLVEQSSEHDIKAPSPVVLNEQNQERLRRAAKALESLEAPKGTIHVWQGSGGFLWDDAEDHGGFDSNVPCGPFPEYLECVQDAEMVYRGKVTVVAGQPERYLADGTS